MKTLSCFLQFIKQHKIIQIFIFPPLLFFSLGYLLYWLIGIISYTPNFARYVAVNTAVLYFLYKLIAKIIKEKYYCYFKDFCIEFYKFLQYLKQFHATHVFVIPPLFFFVITFVLMLLSIFVEGAPKSDFEASAFGFTLYILSFLYLLIQYFSLFLSIIVCLFILYKQFKQKRKIRIKSHILLNNKVYNIMYVIYILIFVTYVIIWQIQPKIVIDFCTNIFLTPLFNLYHWLYYGL